MPDLILFKYIFDTFEEQRAKLLTVQGDDARANAEAPDEYKAENVFRVPADAHWSNHQAGAKQQTTGKTVDDANLAMNFRQYVVCVTLNVREIAAAFDDAILDLEKVNLLYLHTQRYNEKSEEEPLPASMPNHEMDYAFKQLRRKFKEALNTPPSEIIRLMVALVLMSGTDLADDEGIARTVNDYCCGTGRIPDITKEHIPQVTWQAKVFDKQELNHHAWASACSDMLGNTLSEIVAA